MPKNLISEDLINEYVKSIPKLVEEAKKHLNSHGFKNHMYGRTLNTLGGDPEFFITDDDGELIISHRLLGGETIESDKTYKLFADGLAVEVNFHPDGCRAWIIDRMQAALKRLNKLAKKEKGHITFTPIVDLSKKVMNSIPPAYMIWGCEPVYNIYGTQTILPPAETHPLRYAGGHIHFAISKEDTYLKHSIYVNKKPDKDLIKEWIKTCDLLIGIPSVLLSNSILEKTRRTLYGRAGEYRLQPHGIEYRTLSNHYYQHPVMLNLFLSLARDVYNLGWYKNTKGEKLTLISLLANLVSDKELADAINNSDKMAAWKIWTKVYPYMAYMYGTEMSSYKTAMDLIKDIPSKFLTLVLKQPENFFKEYDNYERNWRFDITSDHNSIGGWETFPDPSYTITDKKVYDIMKEISNVPAKAGSKIKAKAKAKG